MPLRDLSQFPASHAYRALLQSESFPPGARRRELYLLPAYNGGTEIQNENLFTLNSIEDIAQHLFVSESYLFRLFKSELHQTPKKYIMDKRLLCAQKMIAEGEKPVAVCEACGFGDYTTFYRNYSAFFGHSPSDERKMSSK